MPPAVGGTRPGPRKTSGVGAGDLGGIAFQLAAAIFLFLFIGRWLDRRLGTGSWLTILFVFVGAGAAFYSMYRKLMAAQRREREERQQRERERR